ncbi:hypothetical protein K7G98_03640 [Saccharothrix sp. MB29]|nr:hypothetical protein [Saccharothrix sp. MB29]
MSSTPSTDGPDRPVPHRRLRPHRAAEPGHGAAGGVRPVLGRSLAGARFTLSFRRMSDPHPLDGEPEVVNLRGGHGYVDIRITQDGVLLYQHPHPVREVVARPLQRILAERYPDEQHWGFGVAGAGLEQVALVRPAPRPAGAMNVRTGGSRRFHVEEVPEPEPPPAAPADFGVTPDDPRDDSPTQVVFTAEAHAALLGGLPLSHEVEEGGFLVGQLFRDRERPGAHLVRITEALPAQRTGASLLRFTFTGESFLRVNDVVSRLGGDSRLVGWYHTHLFPASAAFGLSDVDVALHEGVFRRPWHVAGLINLDGPDRRLRAYCAPGGRGMAELPVLVERQWTR